MMIAPIAVEILFYRFVLITKRKKDCNE